MNRLKNKVAIVYGDGTVGGAIDKAFARTVAKVFLNWNIFTTKPGSFKK